MRIHNNVDVLTYNARPGLCAAIIAHPVTGAFILLDVDAPCPLLPEETRLELVSRKFQFCGVIGIVESDPEIELEVQLAPRVMHAVKVAFLAAIKNKRPAPEDFVAWLNRLWSLQDPRTEN